MHAISLPRASTRILLDLYNPHLRLQAEKKKKRKLEVFFIGSENTEMKILAVFFPSRMEEKSGGKIWDCVKNEPWKKYCN